MGRHLTAVAPWTRQDLVFLHNYNRLTVGTVTILTFSFLSREIKSTSKESYKTSLIKDGIYFRLLFNYQSDLKHLGIQLHGTHSITLNRTA